MKRDDRATHGVVHDRAARLAWQALVASIALVSVARAQEPPKLPPPPPPATPPQYTPPSNPSPAPQPAPRRDREPPRRERGGEREREREREAPPPVQPAPHRYAPQPQAEERDEAPPARHGFQLALRTGLMFPVGNLSSDANSAMSDHFSTQIPLMLELGAKVHRMIFIGAYTQLALGGTGTYFHDRVAACTSNARSCLASSFRLGAEVQIHFQPDQRVNPWAGYGIGLESSAVSATGGGPDVSESFTGFEFARLSGGVDFRISRVFGIGPLLELDLGKYTHEHLQGVDGRGNTTTVDQSIPTASIHGWLTLGVRGVFFP